MMIEKHDFPNDSSEDDYDSNIMVADSNSDFITAAVSLRS